MQTISSTGTNFQRFIITPIIIFGIGLLVWFTVCEPGISLLIKCIAVILWAWGSYYLWGISWALADVKLGDKLLIAKVGKTTAIVPLHTIRDISQLSFTRKMIGLVIVIDLDEPTALGANIKFVAPFHWPTEIDVLYPSEHPLIDELHERAREARRLRRIIKD